MTDSALFALDEENRIVRGRLLPFGELSAPSVSGAEPLMFSAETVTIPADPDVMTFNRLHSQFAPIGRAQEVTSKPDGVYAAFRIAKTPQGDEALADIKAGRVKALSAEVTNLVRDGDKAVSSELTGAALVPVGAFAGAHLFAAADIAPAGEDAEAPGEGETNHLDLEADSLPDDITVTTPEGDTATYTPEATPAEDNQESEAFAAMTASIVPDVAGATPVTPRDDLFALYAAVTSRSAEALAPFKGAGDLFAIASIQDSGPSAVTIGADVRQPQALGELWKRRPFQRKFVPLINHADLTSTRAYGWRWTTEPTVGDYSGNTAEVPSTAVDTEPVTADAARIAGGNKIDRRYYDFNDQAVVESYLRLQTEDYARKSDAKALAAMVSGSTATAIGTAVSGIDDSLVAIVDGALAVINTENTPSFAVVSPELYRTIALTPKDKVFEFLNAGFGLEEGSVEGFRVLPGAVGTGKVLVGAKEAATFFELPGVPIRVDGLDVHHGAVDVAVFGYWASIINNAAALALVDTDRD